MEIIIPALLAVAGVVLFFVIAAGLAGIIENLLDRIRNDSEDR